LRLTRTSFLLPILLLATPALRAEYVVLRSGQRLTVTSYQLLDDKYRLQMKGGFVEVAAAEVVAIEPEDTFAPEPAKPVIAPPYRELVEAAAARHGVDADLITSVIAVESNFDPKAVSRKNARGLMQLLPETAARFGVKNIEDPQENIDGGTQYLRELLEKYNNNLALTLAAYNAGPERVQQYGSVPPFAETISYVRRVKRGYEKSKAESSKKKEETKTLVAPPAGSLAPPTTKTPTRPGARNSLAPPRTLNNQFQ
jgi:soluble lytic murein transglycosylase-like protein